MESQSLLCDEVWLMSPTTTITRSKHANKRHRIGESYTTTTTTTTSKSCFYLTKEDCEEAFRICVKKEMICIPTYVDRLKSNGSIDIARSKAIYWLIQSRSWLNLSFGTVSNAANYFDRFVSANEFNGWKCWVIELVSVACLSIASKFGETAPPPLHEIQMQGLDHSFETGLIERMELSVLKALDWRLICTTPFSYVELMTWNIIDLLAKPLLVDHLIDRLNDLLLCALLDCKFLAFRPSVIAVSALKCVLEELLPSMCDAHLSHFSSLIPLHQKENLSQCHKMMEERMFNSAASMYNYPSSPVTVLTMERVYICADQVDFSLFKVPCLTMKANKKKEED